MRVELTRGSVAAGDDVDAPHRESLDLADGARLGDAVAAALARGYPALIRGGRATWLVVVDGTGCAVVAQQWTAPRWLVDAGAPAPAAMHFRYLAQRDPDEVYAQHQTQPGPGSPGNGQAVAPPSMTRSVPTTKPASGDAR